MLNVSETTGQNIETILTQLSRESRDWPKESINEFIRAIARKVKVCCWASRNWTIASKNVLKFRVSAHRHKGYIYVRVNGADLFDIFLVSTTGKIKKVFTDIYVEDFIDTIDNEIERIPEYQR